MNQQSERWFRKPQVAARYGNVCTRTIDRAVKDGRLPPPRFPFGNSRPYWAESELDAHDRALASPDRRQKSEASAAMATTA
jgi:predicted DNA-binding transcriptional regulator AlpA